MRSSLASAMRRCSDAFFSTRTSAGRTSKTRPAWFGEDFDTPFRMDRIRAELDRRGGWTVAELGALQELLGRSRTDPPGDPALLRRCVLEANRELCERIRQGLADAGPWRQRVLAHVRSAVEEKLRINNPARLEAFLAEPPDAE